MINTIKKIFYNIWKLLFLLPLGRYYHNLMTIEYKIESKVCQKELHLILLKDVGICLKIAKLHCYLRIIYWSFNTCSSANTLKIKQGYYCILTHFAENSQCVQKLSIKITIRNKFLSSDTFVKLYDIDREGEMKFPADLKSPEIYWTLDGDNNILKETTLKIYKTVTVLIFYTWEKILNNNVWRLYRIRQLK